MPKAVGAPSDHSFGYTFVVVFALIALWQGWAGRGNGAILFVGLSVSTFIVTLARPVLLNPLNRAWMRVGRVLHAILSPVVLGAMYFLVLTPYGVVMRLCGRDALKRRLDHTAQSYWVRRDPPGPSADSLPRQY